MSPLTYGTPCHAIAAREQVLYFLARAKYTRGERTWRKLSVVEIGVAQGAFFDSLMYRYSNIIEKYHLIDPRFDQSLMQRIEHWQQFSHTMISFKNNFSMAAVNDFSDNSVDFVYIDGSHSFNDVLLDLRHWWPKVSAGGILSGHDFCADKQNMNDGVPWCGRYGIHTHFKRGRKFGAEIKSQHEVIKAITFFSWSINEPYCYTRNESTNPSFVMFKGVI